MSEITAPQNGAELLARIKPQLRVKSTNICLRPDLLDAWEDAQQELAAAEVEAKTSQGSGGGRLASGAAKAVREAAEKVQALEAEIEDTQVKFSFRAMTKDQFRSLCDGHPPRKGNELDSFAGYDRDAVNDAAVRLCLIDPVFDDASWADFLAVCNPSEWTELRSTVTQTNQSVVDVPKSALASRVLSKRGSTSRQPASGE